MFVIFLLVLKVLCALVGSRTPDVGVFVDTLSGDNIFSDLSIIVGYPRAVARFWQALAYLGGLPPFALVGYVRQSLTDFSLLLAFGG